MNEISFCRQRSEDDGRLVGENEIADEFTPDDLLSYFAELSRLMESCVAVYDFTMKATELEQDQRLNSLG